MSTGGVLRQQHQQLLKPYGRKLHSNSASLQTRQPLSLPLTASRLTCKSPIPADVAPPPPRLGGPLAKLVDPSKAEVSDENVGSCVGSGSGSFFPLNQLMLLCVVVKV